MSAISIVVQKEFQATPGPGEAAVAELDGEGLRVVLERQRIVEAPGLHEAADEDHAVDEEREHGPGDDEGMHADRDRAGEGGMGAAVALAGNGRVVLA
ncbi:hypothetical protein ABIA25_005088 [Sinorhizobium fredii]